MRIRIFGVVILWSGRVCILEVVDVIEIFLGLWRLIEGERLVWIYREYIRGLKGIFEKIEGYFIVV